MSAVLLEHSIINIPVTPPYSQGLRTGTYNRLCDSMHSCNPPQEVLINSYSDG